MIGNFGILCMGLAVPILEYDLACVHEVSSLFLYFFYYLI